MRAERGMTLVEMLVAMTVFVVVLGGALGMLRSQMKGFRRGTDESALLQNLRFGTQEVDHDIRTAGSNTPDDQPPVVYASAFSFAFNADYVSNQASDISAVYIDPDAPTGQVSVLTQKITIPGSSPAFGYPDTVYKVSSGTNSPAETITFFFQTDLETARTDDYMLMRQVNNQNPEPLVRNVLAYPGKSFFQYYYLSSPPSGGQTNQPVPTGWLPLRHTVASHGGSGDTAVAARIDSLRAVELSYRVTNGRPGTEERIRQISTIIPLPNLTANKLQTCGHEPLFGQAVTATQGTNSIDLLWNAATDEAGGEKDVLRYLIWRRLHGAPDWGDPFATMPSGKTVYTFSDGNVTSGITYDYAVAAQDCTPSLSTQATVTLQAP